ncbi:hypothetical protein JHK82_039901 [Glycine max]|nr:hypothetical protein JHK82_039901 [Glycine max]KAG5121970.1 hypothetical protein JHK84_040310 [Glycine max]
MLQVHSWVRILLVGRIILRRRNLRMKIQHKALMLLYLKMNCADNSLLLWRKITIFGAILMGVMILGNWRKLVVYSMRLVCNMRKQVGTQESMRSVGVIGLSLLSNCDSDDDDASLYDIYCRMKWRFDLLEMEMERCDCHQFSLKNLAESLKTLGNKAMQSKKYSDAIELYNCAIAVHEKSAVYYCNRAAAYTQINKYTEAIQDCLRSIEIDPNYTKAYSRLGLVYYAQGNYRDAIHKGFRKALQLDPNNESVKENIRVAERKLLEEQHRAYPNQNTRSSQEFPNQSAQGGSRSHGEPPPFSSMPFNPRDIASMFMNFTNATNAQQQGSHSQERQEDSNGSGASEPEIRIGGNISVNMEDMPEDITGAFQSMMEMLSGAAPPGQPQDQMNGRAAPN